LWTIATLLYARRWLNFSHRFLRYLSQVSYWVYLVHLPLLFFLQFLLTDLSLPLVVKFLLSSVGTIALCLLSFHLLVSWNGLAKMVGGQQQQQS
jgi:glucan biosynthesis protein C